MSVLLVGFLFVIVIPLAEGVLIALLLREVHIRHPLPLGGVIDTPQRRQIRAARLAAEQAREKARKQQRAMPLHATSSPDVAIAHETTDEKPTSPVREETLPSLPPEVSVFEEGIHIPDNLPVNDVINLMTTESSPGMPNDFEHQIEASARSGDDIPQEVHGSNDDMDADDLDALAAALPRKKIDFSREMDEDSKVLQPFSSTAQDVLGENYDFESLKTQSIKLPPLETEDLCQTEHPMYVQEDGAGTVQVSSMFLPNTSPQLADFIIPQTIVPTFLDDWIQETTSHIDPGGEGREQFCFTAELSPMFKRKKKSS